MGRPATGRPSDMELAILKVLWGSGAEHSAASPGSARPKFQGHLVGIPIAINDLLRSRLPVSGYILINLSASACKASASVTW